MELLSKTNSIQHSPRNGASRQNRDQEESPADHILLADLLDSLPNWERSNPMPVPVPSTSSGIYSRADVLYSNVLGQQIELATNAPTAIQHVTNNSPLGNNEMLFGAVGLQREPLTPTTSNNTVGHVQMNQSNKTSPESNSSITCGWCEIAASIRCLDCNEFMCKDCLQDHRKSPFSSNHSLVALPLPIGSSPTSTSNVPARTPPHSNYQCDSHNEILRYVCEYCNKLVCQCCTLREHKDHNCVPIQQFIDDANIRIESSLRSSSVGTKCIKASIDKALGLIRLVEKNCNELTDNIRKSFRQFVIAIEDRERYLLECVEKVRTRRLTILHDQMAGLKSALSGLAEMSEMLNKITESTQPVDTVDIIFKITSGQRQIEQFAAVYKDLQPKQEIYAFVPPDFNLMHELRNQGSLFLTEEKTPTSSNSTQGCETSPSSSTSSISSGGVIMNCPFNGPGMGATMGSGQLPRRPILRGGDSTQMSLIAPIPSRPLYNAASIDWDLGNVPRTSPASFPIGVPRLTQCIPGSLEHVKVRKSNGLSASFGLEGHDDGQVSRPWGVCVDNAGHILVSDRRNNRVQVFNPDTTLKFKFGRKGVGNGEFDLPAGICVDIDNRIIVVDKDNHRVQIFTANGVFILKFGSYGKEYGQFQYPWDVAVNSRRQIVVTDSRNHRIQQFDSEGRFIRQIVFDTHGQFKGVASPRGVCYTPQGNIIVSDFDNHCLYLIDPDINEILSAKGHEGPGFNEFNRPSGICCDDDGHIIVADSKNQRIIVFTPSLDYLWDIEIRPSQNALMPVTLDEKDRTCDVALMPDGRIVFLIELSPDAKEGSNPHKRFIHIY